jgi:hypothetical protein
MLLDLTLVRMAAIELLAVLMLAGCGYGPPVYQGKIDSAALLGDGRVAIGYSQLVWRPPTGLATFPDGGSAQILHNEALVALVDPDGRTREIARYENDMLLGKGGIRIDWFEADPGHLYVTRSGQLTSSLPLRWLHEIHRIDLDGREIARLDLPGELAAQGRVFGAKGVGTQVVDARGTMLVGATREGVRELWRRDPDRKWTLLDRFDGSVRIVGDDFVYQLGDHLLARNWLTGDVRKLMHYNPSTKQSEVLIPGDTALLPDPVYQPTLRAHVRSSGKRIQIMRDNDPIASIEPDDKVLDRR